MASPAQIEANRTNALLSGGPVAPEGRASSSHNAVKFGHTGQTVLLKTDDVELYKTHVQYYVDKFQPANQDERIRVQDIADTEWRLLRIPSSEAAILALGRVKLAPLVANETDEKAREEMLEAEVLLTYRKDFSNLSLQHSRLTRHRLNIAKAQRAVVRRQGGKELARPFGRALDTAPVLRAFVRNSTKCNPAAAPPSGKTSNAQPNTTSAASRSTPHHSPKQRPPNPIKREFTSNQTARPKPAPLVCLKWGVSSGHVCGTIVYP